MPYKMKAAKSRAGYPIDPNFITRIPTYEEIVEVKDGIAIVQTESAKECLLHRGFVIVTDKVEKKETEIQEKEQPTKEEPKIETENKRIEPRVEPKAKPKKRKTRRKRRKK